MLVFRLGFLDYTKQLPIFNLSVNSDQLLGILELCVIRVQLV